MPQEKGAEEVRHRTCAAERMQRAVENQERKRQEKAAKQAAKQRRPSRAEDTPPHTKPRAVGARGGGGWFCGIWTLRERCVSVCFVCMRACAFVVTVFCFEY